MTEIRQSRDAIKEEKLDGEKSRGTSPVRKLEKHDVSSSVFLRSRITRAKSFRNYLVGSRQTKGRKRTRWRITAWTCFWEKDGGGGGGGTGYGVRGEE